MAQCPTCQTKIEEDFGLVTCSGCGAICFVDLDDNVTLQNDDLQSFDLSTLDETTAPGFQSPLADLDSTASISDSLNDNLQNEDLISNGLDVEALHSDDPLDPLESLTGYDDPVYGDAGEAPLYGLNEESTDSSEIGKIEDDSDTITDSLEAGGYQEEDFEEDLEDSSILEAIETTDDLLDDVADEVTNPEVIVSDSTEESLGSFDVDEGPESVAPMSLDDFLNEIETFGSLASEPFQQSAFFFDITVSAIDSKEIRREIIETLSNSKLGIEEDEISKKIRNGELRLHQIPAVKAAVMIQSLSHLNCELDWELKEAQDLSYDDGLVDEGAYQEENLENGLDEPDLIEDDSFDDLIDEYTEEEPDY